MANRYQELLAEIPSGSFYDSVGQIIPYQSTPYEFPLSGVTPSALFDVFVNEEYRGTITSDGGGNAIVSVTLNYGRQDLLVVGERDRITAYLDVRAWATILSAHAAVIETIDAGLDNVQDSLALETATSGYLGDAYGQLVWQPDDLANWLLDSYRGLIRRLRQGFRIYGSKLEGLREVVSAYTSSLPRRMTDWRPRWILGNVGPGSAATAAPAFTWTRTTTSPLYTTADPSVGVNQRSVTFIHASHLASASNIFPNPQNPATPGVLVVLFQAGWSGGPVTISGTAPDASPLSEVFNYTGPGIEEVDGTETFATVTGITKTTIGGGQSVRVGVRNYFITLVDIGDLNFLGTLTLDFLTSPERLQWNSGPTVDVSATSTELVDGRGRVTLRTPDRAASWVGLLPDGGVGYAVGDEHFLALETDDRGVIIVDLANAAFNGDTSPRTAAQVATSISTYFLRDPRYGAVASVGVLECNPYADANTFSFTLDDGPHPAVTFTYNGGGPNIIISPGDSAAVVATKTRDAINAQYENLRIVAGIDPTDATKVLLTNDYGGTQGNVVITFTGTALASATGMAGGLNGSFGSATVVSDGDGLGDYVFLDSVGTEGEGGSLRVWPIGADASPVVFGHPRRRSTLSTAAAFRDVLLDLPLVNRLPSVAETVILHDAVPDTTATVTTGFATPSRTRAVEVVFDAAWRGGTIRIFGTDVSGAALTEDFVGAPPVITTGTGTGDGSGNVTASSGTFANVRPGMFLELTTGTPGAGRFITRVVSPSILTLESALPFISQSYRILEATTTKGVQAFTSVAQWTNLTPQSARPSSSPAGTGTLSIIDGDTYGYTAMVGRGFRASVVGATLAPLVPDNTATLTFTGSLTWEHADLGGYVLITAGGAGSGTNNGLHRIIGLNNTAARDVFTLQHGEYDRGGRFIAEVVAFRLYSAGELVRVAAKSSGNLTLFPPGVLASWAIGAAVEDEDEMPLEVRGVDGVGTITVDVDRTYVPATAQASPLTLVGTYVPDGWRTYNITNVGQSDGWMVPRRLLLQNVPGTDPSAVNVGMALEHEFDVVDYRGRMLEARFWAQQHKGPAPAPTENLRIRFSFDGGAFTVGSVPPGSIALEGDLATNPEGVVSTGLIPNPVVYGDVDGVLDPAPIYGRIEVPYDAGSVRIRLEYVDIETARMSVEGCVVGVVPGDGSWLGSTTVPRSEHRSKFGELLYVWSPEPLTTAEDNALGLEVVAPQTADQRGQIDRVVNAHGVWDRVDVSEYDSGTALNVRGTYDDVGWLGGTLTNMEVGVGTPPRASVVRPSYISLVENEPLTFTAPSNATLAETSAHDGPYSKAFTEEMLLEDGVPVPATPLNVTTTGTAGAVSIPDANGYQTLTDGTANFDPSMVGRSITLASTAVAANDGVWLVVEWVSTTVVKFDNPGGAAGAIAPGTYVYNADGVLPWRFLSSSVVQLASVAAGDPVAQAIYDSTANYVLSYRRLIRAEPGPFDLGASFADYVWLVDAAIWRRTEPSSTPFQRTISVVFLANFTAPLDVPANTSVAATLTVDDGLQARLVPASDWSFTDPRTVSIAATAFSAASIYTLSYTGLEAEYVAPAEVVIEERSSSVSLADVLLQTWREVAVDDNVDRTHRYHQLRVTVSNVILGVVERGTNAEITGRVVMGTFGPPVTVGRTFRVTTGAHAGASAHIVSVATDRLVLDDTLGDEDSFVADWEVRTSRFGTDIEISGLGLRGVNLYGSPPNAPGLI